MIRVRRSNERGRTDLGWLDSRHTFSFGNYWDPDHMGYANLRVINDDRVAGGQGFGAHPHRDMEIISYVVEGGLAHRDSMGNGSVIKPGDVQRMSAGRGVLHSEMNASRQEPVRFLQIWIPPHRRGLEPSYEQKHFDAGQRRDRLRLLVSPDGADDSVTIHSDARLYGALLSADGEIAWNLEPDRGHWIQVVTGQVLLDSDGRTVTLQEGDGAALEDVGEVRISGAGQDSEIIVFELPRRAA